MKFSIGHRLFLSVLLAILAVAASAVYLLRQNVLASFGDYAVGIELDRLDELSGALAARYRDAGGWTFLPAADARRGWIAAELARLQEARQRRVPAPPAVPVVPAAPQAPAAAAAPQLSSPANAHTGRAVRGVAQPDIRHALSFAPPAPPAPPAPSVPPAPPAPPALLPPLPFAPAPPSAPADAADTAGASLAQRVTLLDARGAYLAGRALPPEGALPLARRPIVLDGRTLGYLGVTRSPRPSDAMALAFLEQLRSSLALIVAVAVTLSALAAVLLARHFRQPIARLAAGAGALAQGDFTVRLTDTRSDELGELARHFNALAEQLGRAEGARRQWVADTSHELRTPLAVLRAQLEALQDGVRSATPDTLAAMLRQVLSLNKLIDELYALARADVGALDCKPVALDLWRFATAHAQGFVTRLQGAGLALELGAPPDAGPVLADPDRLRQVLDNLFENSLRYTAPGGRLRLQAQAGSGHLHLVLDDSAPGVPDAALARLGERFYRVDASRSRAHGGAGLGLALCRRLLEAQGGRLDFAHSALGGLRATLALPLAAQEGPRA
ncbi:ATP-binding protein [Massilia sp. MS-15]|uniref:ATP-binding protein n=1 Tax=Massilia sp. MS-15 TaxID=2878200 RepID=UPI001CD5E013|nr:HAMP domain-containing protein [Massilia sp. MS-15]